jgi:hypothetical protein
MHTDLVLNVAYAIGNTQIRYIPTYCKGVYQNKQYKSYSNMFRLIHEAVIREYTQYSCLVKNIYIALSKIKVK